jgi:hypothetical protein
LASLSKVFSREILEKNKTPALIRIAALFYAVSLTSTGVRLVIDVREQQSHLLKRLAETRIAFKNEFVNFAQLHAMTTQQKTLSLYP